MDDYKNNEDRKSLLLEGMYNGVAGKIDEVRQSVQRELQYNSAQQADAYEALAEEFRTGVESLRAELRYVAQQSSAIYDYNSQERNGMRDALLEEVRAQAAQVFDRLAEHFDRKLGELGAGAPQNIDYDALAEKVAARLSAQGGAEEAQAEAEAQAGEAAEKPAMEVVSEPAEEAAEAVSVAEPATPAEDKAPAFNDDAFDYELLAEKIATAIPETDYDLIADKVVAALPQADEARLAERIAAVLPQTDENAIADRVAESLPLTDYDLIAERVVAALTQDAEIRIAEESIERIAERVAELLRREEPELIERVAEEEFEEPEAEEEQGAEIAAAAAAVAEPPKKAAAKKGKAEPAPAVAVAVPAPPEGMMTRYKRSFIAKIIESEDDVKDYYSELKNALLAYQKAASQVSWSNDRFTLKGETVAKIGIRGRTLCLYVALNPEEFPETVYHQKFAGDTKMYEKTPMMVKIKSNVALKRAIRLVALLMEKNGAVGEEKPPIDYAAQYAYRSEEELLAEGLIKTAIVEKSDLDF